MMFPNKVYPSDRLSATAMGLAFATLTLAAVSLGYPDALDSARGEDSANLDQRVRILERLREVDAEDAAAKKAKATSVSLGSRGFKAANADSSHVLRLNGFLQNIGYFHPGDTADALNENFTVRRARLDIRAQVGRYFEMRLHQDFAGGSPTLLDAHVDFVLGPAFRARVGKFKPPIGFERLQSPSRLHFPDFALTSALTPNRDIGLEFSGIIGKADALEYALGVFNGVQDGGNSNGDSNGDKDFAGRVLVRPFRTGGFDPLYDLALGFSGSAGYHNGALPAYTASARGPNRFFGYRASDTAQGRLIRWSPHGAYYYGPLSLIAEYVSSTHETRAGTSAPEKLTHTAWQATAGLVLSGEASSWRGVKPRRPIDLDSAWAGAWEVVGRVQQVSIDDKAFPRHANPDNAAGEALAWAAGLNWHANENVKVMLNYEHTAYGGGAAGNRDRDEERVVQASFNVSY